jgi:hypothetical protein
MRKRQRSQEHAFDDGEDRGVCTDPERERQDSDQSESGRFAQLAKSEFKIVHVVTVIIQHEAQ